MRPTITYQKHRETVPEAQTFFPGVGAEEYPGGEGFAAIEWVELSTHNGTHLDTSLIWEGHKAGRDIGY